MIDQYEIKQGLNSNLGFILALGVYLYFLIRLLFQDYLFLNNSISSQNILSTGSFLVITSLIFVFWILKKEQFVHFSFISLQPFWNRGGSYFDVMPLGEFFYFSGQFVILAIYSIFLLTRIKTYIKFDKNLVFFMLFCPVVMLVNMIIYGSDETSTALFIYHLVLTIFMTVFIGYFLQSERQNYLGLKAVKYLYLSTFLFLIIEIILKASMILKNPQLLLTYGLRLGADTSNSGLIAPLSGGIHDLLYFAFMFSIWPLIAKKLAHRGIISLSSAVKTTWCSVILVLLVFSKTPIIISFFSLIASGSLKFNLKTISILIITCLPFTSFLIKIYDRFVILFGGLIALGQGGLGGFNTVDSSSASRFINISEGWNSFIEHPFIGSEIIKIFTSLPVALIFNFGVVLGSIAIYLILWRVSKLPKLEKRIAVAFLLYSVLTFGNLAGVPGGRIPDGLETREAYIFFYGWIPTFNFGNLLTTSLFVILLLSFGKSSALRKHV